MSVENWLNELDPALTVYSQHLKELRFSSTNMIKFLKLKDFQKIPNYKLTPDSKSKGEIETPDSEDDGVKRRKNKSCANSSKSTNLPPRKLFDATVPKEQSQMPGKQTILIFVVFYFNVPSKFRLD